MYNYISEHKKYRTFSNKNKVEELDVKVSDLEKLINKEKDLDLFFLDKFPIKSFGKANDLLKVKNFGYIVKLYNETRDNQLDFIENINNVEYIGINNENQLILQINEGNEFNKEDNKSNGIVGNCIYDASFDFMEEFKMGRYGKHCIKEEQNDLLKKNIVEQLESSNNQVQFRFLLCEDINYIRAITSKDYVNYNNNIALYLTGGLLHNVSLKTGIQFEIEKAQVSDSGIRLFIISTKDYIIKDVAKIKVGLLITNGELKDKTLSCNIRYTFTDIKDKSISFNAVTSSIEEPIFDIVHKKFKPENIIKKLNNIKNLFTKTDSMFNHIKAIKQSETLSSDSLYYIFDKITKDRTGTISKDSKKNFRALYDKHLITNSLSIIKGFNLIDSIFTNIEERLFLEKIYYEVIKNILS